MQEYGWCRPASLGGGDGVRGGLKHRPCVQLHPRTVRSNKLYICYCVAMDVVFLAVHT